jgi:hypothetical protein
MRTSGSGASDVWMTAIPIAILIVFVMAIAGGPSAFLVAVDGILRSIADWVMSFLS